MKPLCINSADEWEINRVDERLFFGLDVGSGKNKVLGLGCDLRKVADVQCDMAYLPFKNKSFVIALFRHSLEHTSRWRQSLEEAERVAQVVYVILPKKELWHIDKTHVPFFQVEGRKLAEYKYGECVEVTKHAV